MTHPLSRPVRGHRGRHARVGPRLLALALLALGIAMSAAGPARAEDGRPTVELLHVDSTITPVMANYISRGISDAVERGDSAVILEMDTPGGLSSAMDDIIKDILASPIPVITWVAPNGARAASAGMYITYASHVAAMAPTTNIGSATPIDLNGDETAELTPSQKKVINDAVAKVQALAELRGRNAEWAESAVRDAANITASQAVDMGVVDFIATDLDDLLAQSDGRVVQVVDGQTTVHTAGAEVHEDNMNFFERVMQTISDPNIALVLISLGTLALIFELSNPGLIFPGVLGGLMLLLCFYSLGTIDTNWAGLGLIVFAFILFASDVFLPTHGILTVGGIIAFVVGGLILANSSDNQAIQLSQGLVYTIAIAMGIFFLTVVGAAARARRWPPKSGPSTVLGTVGVARTPLNPSGMIFLNGELWQATSLDGPIAEGEQVRVAALRGIQLDVVPLTSERGTPVDPAPSPA